jgi:hypothetical protein
MNAMNRKIYRLYIALSAILMSAVSCERDESGGGVSQNVYEYVFYVD